MDSEKHQEVQELIKNGRSPNDEGPFYHHTFWESYKGSVKGKLGGIVIGAAAGAAIGTALFLLVPGIAATMSALTVIGGMSAVGMLYAKDEFSDVGRITGAVAAAHKDAETRMQTFEKSNFVEIKQDIEELKAIVTGKTPPQATVSNPAATEAMACEEVEKEQRNYRTTHHDETIPKPKGGGLVFWKVALVGLAVGASVGALLSAVGMATLATGLPLGLGALVATPSAAAVTGGVIGASFGINRDAFRRVFDKTDLLFKGMFNLGADKATGVPQPEQTLSASKERPQVSTLVYTDSGIEYPVSDTFHRDQLAARANQVLASMDHTTASRH